MKEKLAGADVAAALEKMAQDMAGQAEQLRQLDAAIGDGDLGITMTIGFEALVGELRQLAGSDVSTLLMKSGMAFNRKAASTFGALFATMMMGAAKAIKGKEEIGTPELAGMLAAAAEGVKARGKAQVGDKTLLDALVPAAEELKAAAEAGAALPDALQRATKAAETGMLATAGMKSKVGRASWFAERTEGVQDPGATAVYLMLRSLTEFVQN